MSPLLMARSYPVIFRLSRIGLDLAATRTTHRAPGELRLQRAKHLVAVVNESFVRDLALGL